MSDNGAQRGLGARAAALGRRGVATLAFLLVIAGLGLSAMSVVERRGGLRIASLEAPGLRFYTPAGGGAWAVPAAPARIAGSFALLVHGLDEPGDIWDDLAPALHEAGHAVARFDYPNDQAIADSAGEMIALLTALGEGGTERVDIVAHSMGGLVSRDALTRPGVDRSGWPAIGTLVMVGTPHQGSAFAPLRGVAELRDRFQQYSQGDSTLEETLDFSSDGNGEAGRDLTPGSAFLSELNARPRPRGVRLVCVVGRWSPAWADGVGGDALGDGVVSVESATLEGAEIVEVRGNHRGMLRVTPFAGPPVAISATVEALAASGPPARGEPPR